MSALSAARDTPMMAGKDLFVLPHGAAVTIHRGSMVMMDPASGTIKPAVTATGKVCAGRAERGTSDDAVNAHFRRGIFLWENSASGDLIATAQYGATVYMVDDQTVAKTDGTGTRSAAGICRGVDAGGRVWVEV